MNKKTKDTVIEEKSKKNECGKFSFKEVIIISLIAIIFGLLLGSFIVYSKYNSKGESKNNTDSIKYVYDSIINDYYGEVSEQDLLDGAIEGMISSLKDPYALYLKPSEALQFNKSLNGNFVGIGITININKDDKIEIISVSSNSPASKAGMMVGDIILSMDGVSYDKKNYEDMGYAIQSSENGSKKKFELLRGEETIHVTATLDEIEIETVGSSVYPSNGKKIGIIKIVSFSSNTYMQFLNNYKNLENEGIDSLIIDLRDNSGGYLSAASSIASHFVEKDAVLYKKTNGKVTDVTVNEKERTIKKPVVLLINERTASSAEVFASCLRDNLNVDIVGVTSYGKGTVQKLVSLSNGSSLKFTVYEWLTSNGNKIDGIGIKPTKEVKLDGSGVDNQLVEAINIAELYE